MAGFFDRLLGRGAGKGSGATAKERLQFVLVHDRINLPPERLQAMKAEILAVISRYVEVDSANVDIALQQRDRDSLIVAEIPFSGGGERDEARRRLSQDKSSPAYENNNDQLDDG